MELELSHCRSLDRHRAAALPPLLPGVAGSSLTEGTRHRAPTAPCAGVTPGFWNPETHTLRPQRRASSTSKLALANCPVGPKTRKDRRHLPKEGSPAPLVASRRPPGWLPPSRSVHSRSLTKGSLSTLTVSLGTLHTASLVIATVLAPSFVTSFQDPEMELHFLFLSLHRSERPHSESAAPFSGLFRDHSFHRREKRRCGGPWGPQRKARVRPLSPLSSNEPIASIPL